MERRLLNEFARPLSPVVVAAVEVRVLLVGLVMTERQRHRNRDVDPEQRLGLGPGPEAAQSTAFVGPIL